MKRYKDSNNFKLRILNELKEELKDLKRLTEHLRPQIEIERELNSF